MDVYKFGGASVADAQGVRNVTGILEKMKGRPVMVVVSAMGKTTNALETVAEAYYAGRRDEALEIFRQLFDRHIGVLRELTTAGSDKAEAHLDEFRTEVEWLLHDRPVHPFDYYYDQIVCVGELISTVIVAAALQAAGRRVQWVDVRDIIRTDDQFRSANIDMTFTAGQVDRIIKPAFASSDIVLTQGFIGATDENESTTLGREGSDYTAAVFASLLGANALTIWKDVPGVMNADPRTTPDAVFIPTLSYDEAVEMTFYGAQVIHPKTLHPLRKHAIPLQVRSFVHPEATGTLIGPDKVEGLPPIVIRKDGQVMMELKTQDRQFLRGEMLTRLFEMLDDQQLSVNLISTEALGVKLCADDRPERVEAFCLEAAGLFEIELRRGLSMLSLRHSTAELIRSLTAGRQILMRTECPQVAQFLFGD